MYQKKESNLELAKGNTVTETNKRKPSTGVQSQPHSPAKKKPYDKVHILYTHTHIYTLTYTYSRRQLFGCAYYI